jgi:hypothetical protein
MSSTENTLLSIVVDRSGSMETMGKEPYNAINTFVNDQKGDNTDITLLRFDNVCERIIDVSPSNDFSITQEDILPRGTTALFQAIGEGIEYTESRIGEYDKVIFMIMTDGEENSSQGRFRGEEGRKLVKELISKNEAEKWEFYFLGANIDSRYVGDSLGFSAGHCIDFTPNVAGCASAVRCCSQAVSRARVGDSSDFNDDEREMSMGLDSPSPPITRNAKRRRNISRN